MVLREEERICGERSGTMTCRLFIEISSVSFSSFFRLSSCELNNFSGVEEPVFGRPLKVDTYAQVKQQRRYIS